jgi:hypothetical protein
VEGAVAGLRWLVARIMVRRSQNSHLTRSKEPPFRLHHSWPVWLPLVWEVLFPLVIGILLYALILSELPLLSAER